MVPSQTRRRKTLKLRFVIFLAKVVGIFVIAAFFTSLAVVSTYKLQGESNAGVFSDSEVAKIDDSLVIDLTKEEPKPEPEPEPEPVIKEVNFQAAVEAWAKKAGGKSGVYIYDLDNNKVVANYNGDERFETASLYKLFVVYEGYRRLESGEWSANSKVGGTGKTILQCLDLAIRESNSPCAEALHSKIGYSEMAEIIKEDFGLENTSAKYLYSTPEEIAKMMKIFYEHKDIKSAEYLAQIKDSFLNQPKTTYDWRRGLPKGFSDKVDVYNKVGWEWVEEENYWKIYDDAAIVKFKDEDRTFIVVEMTSRVGLSNIVNLGKTIETEFYSN